MKDIFCIFVFIGIMGVLSAQIASILGKERQKNELLTKRISKYEDQLGYCEQIVQLIRKDFHK